MSVTTFKAATHSDVVVAAYQYVNAMEEGGAVRISETLAALVAADRKSGRPRLAAADDGPRCRGNGEGPRSWDEMWAECGYTNEPGGFFNGAGASFRRNADRRG